MKHAITLRQIRAAKPCEPGWRKLVKGLGTRNLNATLTIGDVAAINGAEDAMWCLRLVDDPRARVRAVLPAVKRASKHTKDKRVHDCIAVIQRWLCGQATDDELRVARSAAYTAALAAPDLATVHAANAAIFTAGAAFTVNLPHAAADYAALAVGDADNERNCQRRDLIRLFGRLGEEKGLTRQRKSTPRHQRAAMTQPSGL